MDVGGYRHNYEGFYKKSTYQISINRERTTTTQCPCKPCGNFLMSFLFLLVKSFEGEIQPFRDRVDTARGYTIE